MASSRTRELSEHVAQLYRAIYAIVRKVPRGRVITYGQLAELAGIPGGARVAGAALKVGAPGSRLPWQRVVGKASANRGRIAIHDPVGAAVQRQLLDDEGVEIGDSGLIALDRYGWLPGSKPSKKARNAATTALSARAASPRRRPRSGSTRRASSSRR